jgi:intein/homing endonuclease
MSQIVLPNPEIEVIDPIDQGWIELASSEIEELILKHPDAAQRFMQKYIKREINWDQFSPSERSLLFSTLVEKVSKSDEEQVALKALLDADFVRTPVSPEEFLTDPQYLGPISKSIYPYWKEHLIYALEPKNAVFQFILTGGIGIGKCQFGTTLLFTDSGVLTIEELYKNKNKINKVKAETGVFEVEDYHDEGETETRTITTKLGYEDQGRPNHRLRVFQNNSVEWKQLEDINVKDTMVLVRKNNLWGTNPYNISTSLAEIFGCIVGDGCIKPISTVELTFGPDAPEQEYQQKMVNLLEEENLNPKVHKYFRADTLQTVHRVSINSRRLVALWDSWGLKGKSWEKIVPLAIRMGTKEVVAAFIRGLFDTDGTVYEKGNAVEFTTCSTKLAEQIQILFLNFGIRSSRTFKANDFRGAWTVRLIGRDSKEIFAKEIGFSHPKKAARLKALLEKEATTWRHNDNEIIPVSWEEVAKVRDSVRGKGLNLKHNRNMFVCVKTKGKQAFTYKALDKIVESFGEQHLTPILLKIYKERYVFDAVVKKEFSTGHCYDITVKGDPSYISNGFISHNTRIAIIAQLYKLYVLSCLKNIPRYFGLDDATKLCFGLFTLSLSKAESALSDDFKRIIGLSPYFKNIFPLRKKASFKRVLNTVGDQTENYEVVLPQNIFLLIGSKIQHALSLAVISGILDEMNFRSKKTVKADDDGESAQALFNQIESRIISRFHKLGSTPGILCVISSKQSNSDFLEGHINKLKNDSHVLIAGGSQWDVKPDDYSKNRFYVFMGTSKTSSRILDEGEEKLYPENSPNILSVPVDLRHRFDYDLNNALRELAGVATSGIHRLFEDPLQVSTGWDETRQSPFTQDIIELGVKGNNKIQDYLKKDEFFRDAGFAIIPKHHPGMMRVLHIDLSKSRDITGISMGGISAIREQLSKNPEGDYKVAHLAPELWVDFALGLKAPQGDQIDYEKIHQFIVFLRESRFRIRYITFDQYQSVSPMQMLIKNNFTVDNLSVDKTDLPYIMLKDAFISKNISMYKHFELEKELINLTHDYNNPTRAKVDHPLTFADGSAGSKDIADSLAGVVFNCMELLTNVGKFPDTANVGMAKSIISNLFPAMEVEAVSEDHSPKNNEFSQLDWYTQRMNPNPNYKLR